MTIDNVKKHYERLQRLAKGDFSERDFDATIKGTRKGEEDGRMTMGSMPEARRQLIMSDAKRYLAELEEKAKAINPRTMTLRSNFSSVIIPEIKASKEKKEVKDGSN